MSLMGRTNWQIRLARIFILLQLLCLPFFSHAAAYATEGSGKFKNEILWLTWGDVSNPYGKAGVNLVNGSKSSITWPVASGKDLQVTCTLTNPTGTLQSYRPGSYGRDRLNYLYRVGDQLVTGVVNTANGAKVDFSVICNAKMSGQDIALKGFVVADAESMSVGEYLQSEAEGDWYVIDRFSNPDSTGEYQATKTAVGGGVNSIRMHSTTTNPANTAVTFLKFSNPAPSKTMKFSIKGEGKTAIAIGLVVPYADFGDAPASYGDAFHLLTDIELSQDGIGAAGSADVAGVNSGGFQLANFLPPSDNYLGTRGPDVDNASQPSVNADQDDLVGLYRDEENAWPSQLKVISGLQIGSTFDVVVACKGRGYVSGWIDFNLNGVFDSNERSQVAQCAGTAPLRWTVPDDLQATPSGQFSYVRLRYASAAADVQSPTGQAQNGEVEDHSVTIAFPKLSISKSSNVGSAGWTVGQANARYTLAVSNTGQVPTGPGLSGTTKPLKVLDIMPRGITPGWTGTQSFNGWTCSASGQLVSCETSTHLQAGGQSVIDLPVNVLADAATGNDLINYASVGGGLDPNNKGEPLNPQGCTTAGYCSNTTVNIGQPAITVAKSAVPAAQTQVKAGDVISYTLMVNIKSTATLSPIGRKDTLCAGLEYVGIASNPGGFTEGVSGLSRVFTLPAGKATGQYVITYQARVEADARAQVQNLVVPQGGGSPNDPNAGNPSCNGNCATQHPVATPLVTVSKISDPATGETVREGQVITYTLRTVIERSQTLSPVVLTDTLGAGLRVGAVVSNDGYELTRLNPTTGTLTLPVGTAPGTYEIKYTALVNTAASGSQELSNVLTAVGGGNVGETPTCSSCQTNHQISKPKVEYSKSTSALSAKITETISYQIQVKVSDAPTTDALTLTDSFQAGLTFNAMQDQGLFTVASSSANSLVLTLPKGTPPGIYRATYLANVVTTTPVLTEVTNKLTGAGGDSPVCASTSGCATKTPLTFSEIDFSKALLGNVKDVKVGQELEFVMTITVGNTSTALSRIFKDVLGTGLIKAAKAPISSAAPTGWTVQWNAAGTQLDVTTPAVLPAGTYKVHYFATVTKDAVGTVKNAVSAVPVAGVYIPHCSQNCATETPVAPPKIGYHKTSTVTSAKVGESIPYVLTIKVDDAVLQADAELLVDNLGSGLSFNNDVVVNSQMLSTALRGKSLVIKFQKGTVPGTYTVSYSAKVTEDAVKSVNNRVDAIPAEGAPETRCDASCTVVTPVTRAIDAVDDPLSPVKSNTGSPYAGNAYDNDTLNGVAVELGKITGKVLTPAAPLNGGSVPVLDVATGIVSVPPGTPAGDYSIVYQICDKLASTVCDMATITIKVTASPIDAKDDSYTGSRGSGGDQEVGNAYSENDRLDGTPFTPDRITGTVITPAQSIGGDPRVPVLDVVTGKVTVPSGTPAGDYAIHYRICEKLNPSNCDDAVIKVTVKPDESLLRIVKTAAVRTVKIGDLVRYSLQVQNIGAVKVVNANVIDTAANGFTFVNGSMSAVGLGLAVTASGVGPVQLSGVTLDVGQTGTIVYMMRVGAGVRPGNHINTAFARNGSGDSISNQATASVELVSDPLLDDSLIFGTVFDDRDRDGWQDNAKLTGLKAQGGFAPEAYIANSTTVDKGQGAEPQADASAPLLHGLNLGSITARQSEADPVAKHTVVIHQKLNSLDFSDDFVLTNDQGVTVRMNAAGLTTVEKTGEAAAGRNAAQIEVERKISQTAEGYGVDYIIRSTGIDERGIPGVRVASVEGLLMETDPFGRYHLVGVNGGRWERGRHFILKVDPSTLPAGAEFTTSNPLLRRITPGLPVRFDFGVQLNPEFMAGEQKTAEIELGSVLFAAGSTEIRSQYLGEQGVIAQVAAKLQQYRGGELLISANGESEAVAFARAEAVRKAVIEQLPAEVQAATKVSVRRDVNDANSLISGVTADGAVLGSVLFETDKAVVRPEYQALLAKVGAYLNTLGGGVVSLIGHTDVRASHAYNQKLGLARAKAVYEALLPHLSEDLKKHLQVQAEAANASAHRPVPKAASH